MTTKQDDIIIKIEKRTLTGKKVSQLRRQGILPGVVYGHKVESYPVQMDTHSTSLLMKKITPTTLVSLDLDGKKTKAIVRERVYDVVTGHLLHLDFMAVSMTEKLRAKIALELVRLRSGRGSRLFGQPCPERNRNRSPAERYARTHRSRRHPAG